MRSPPRWAPRILSDSRRLTTDAGRITFPLGITMKILSLKLPASLDAELEAAAARRRTTKSALLREALASYLAREAGAPQASEIPDEVRESAPPSYGDAEEGSEAPSFLSLAED